LAGEENSSKNHVPKSISKMKTSKRKKMNSAFEECLMRKIVNFKEIFQKDFQEVSIIVRKFRDT